MVYTYLHETITSILSFITLRSEYKRSIVPICTNSGSYLYYRICTNEHGWEAIYGGILFIILEIPTFIEQLMNSTREPLQKLENVIGLIISQSVRLDHLALSSLPVTIGPENGPEEDIAKVVLNFTFRWKNMNVCPLISITYWSNHSTL